MGLLSTLLLIAALVLTCFSLVDKVKAAVPLLILVVWAIVFSIGAT
jgi:hypothetical protein